MGEQNVPRERLVSAAFVEIVDQLVGEFDVIEMLTVLVSRCVDLLDAAAAGILLADDSGHLRVTAASTEEIRLLELFQVQNHQGPCLDCYSTGAPVIAADLGGDTRWPEFAAVSRSAGYPSVSAVPMRLGTRVLGCLNLFMAEPTALPPADVALAQALADVASIAIVQAETARQATVVQSQLQGALESRVAIEQAKGMVSQSSQCDMDAAFGQIRAYARNNNRQLTDVARSLANGSLDVTTIAASARHRG